MWKQFVKDYFTFTRKERQGILTVIGLILIIVFVPWLFPIFHPASETDHSEFAKEIQEFKASMVSDDRTLDEDNFLQDYTSDDEHSTPRVALQNFDPNTTSEQDWIRMGLRPKTARTIQNYVAKGGRFRKPDDLRKIWGLSKKDADRIVPFVRIESKDNAYEKKPPQFTAAPSRTEFSEPRPAFVRSKEYTYTDINLADTTAFKKFPGIGSKLAERIVNYRNKLGGFYSVQQLGETYLLPDTTFQKMLPYLQIGNPVLNQININTVSLDELRTHPYIKFSVANAIIQYRAQHGNFSAPADLKKIMIISDSLYARIQPYIKVE